MADKPTAVEALSAVMADVQAVRKDGRNTQQGYVFRGIDAVVNAVGPALRKHGVIAVPHASTAHYRDVQTSTGKPSRECTVSVTYRFYGPKGDFIECTVPGESMDFGDKGAPKAMSVAYRIALLQALCIPTDEPEPDAQSYERAAPPKYDPAVQQQNAEDLLLEIEQAADGPALENVGRAVKKALSKREITQTQYARLIDAGAARRATLDQDQAAAVPS